MSDCRDLTMFVRLKHSRKKETDKRNPSTLCAPEQTVPAIFRIRIFFLSLVLEEVCSQQQNMTEITKGELGV